MFSVKSVEQNGANISPQISNNELIFDKRGCLHEKTLTGASFTLDDYLISYRVYMMTGSFHILLFNGTFHVDKIHVWFKIAYITHALPVPRSGLPVDRFHTEMGGRFAFT